MTDHTGKIINGIRWLTVGKLVSQLISWSITIIVIRMLDPASYGLMAVAMALIGMLTIFSSLGMEELLVHHTSASRLYQRQALTLLMALSLLLMGVAIAIASPYALWLDNESAGQVVIVLSCLLPITALTVLPECMLERAFKMREIALIDMCALTVSSLTSLLLAYSGKGVWALVAAALINQTIRAIGFILMAKAPCLPCFSFKKIIGDLHFATRVMGNRVTWHLTQTLDDVLIGQQLGEHQLGLYKVGKNFALLPLQKVAGIIHQVTYPAVVNAKEHQRPDMVLAGLSLICLVTFPVFFGVAVISDPLVELLFGEKWRATAPILAALSLLMPVKALNNFLGTATSASGAPGTRWKAQLLLLVTTVTAVFLGISHHDELGETALYIMYGHYLVLPLLLLLYLRVLKITIPQLVQTALGPWLSALLCYGLVNGIEFQIQAPAGAIVLDSLIFGCAYLMLATMFHRPALMRLLRLLRTRTD